MKKLKKTILVTVVMSMAMTSTSFAAWKNGTGENQDKWWYDNGNEVYASNGWQWIDGNNDGVAECYYFDANGWLLVNTTTPDGHKVDENGAWIVNGVIQTQTSKVKNIESLEDISIESIRKYLSDKEIKPYFIFASRYGEEADRMVLELCNYLDVYHNRKPFKNENTPQIEDFKAYYKEQVDFYLDYLGATDFSDVNGELNGENFEQKILNEHKFNMHILDYLMSETFGRVSQKIRICMESRTGTYQGKSYEYYFVYPVITGNGQYSFDNRYERGFGWFSDIARYAETGNEAYLFHEGFFPDIIDSQQRADDGHLMSIEEYRKKVVEDRKTVERNWDLGRRRSKAEDEGEYIEIRAFRCYNVIVGYPLYDVWTWYMDDSLNDMARERIISIYGINGYEKVIEEISKAQKGETLTIDLSSYYLHK